jgi:hypothetical protein
MSKHCVVAGSVLKRKHSDGVQLHRNHFGSYEIKARDACNYPELSFAEIKFAHDTKVINNHVCLTYLSRSESIYCTLCVFTIVVDPGHLYVVC